MNQPYPRLDQPTLRDTHAHVSTAPGDWSAIVQK